MRQIAIDGPAGAGKSTIAKEISRKLGFMYVDTGAMYRTIGLAVLRAGVSCDDENGVSEVCEKVNIDIIYADGVQHMYLEGEDVSGEIRKEAVGNAASAVSRFAAVRTRLVALQQELGEKYDVVMDGRDIGTVVLPNADPKIYLTASSRCRAERRYKELVEKGESCDIDAIQADIEARDYQDSHRAISPLKKADDAVEIDSSDMSIAEVVDAVVALL